MKKTLLLWLCLALLPIASKADKVTQTQAKQIALNFINKMGGTRAGATTTPKQFKKSATTTANYAPYYVYNVEGNQGFVIVSGDDAVGPVLGYSDNGSFEMENAPENIKAMLKLFELAVNNAPLTRGTVTDAVPSKGTPVVEPLLGDIQWGQDAPFNGKCPVYTDETGANKNYYVGCVATAMAQIMRYYNYPAKGTGSKTYKSNVGELTADFGNTTYQWDLMPARLEKENADAAQNDAVATLCAQLGVSVNMSYAPNGSGAYSQMVRGAMVDYFGYDKGIAYRVRGNYNTNEWMDIIKAELDAKRPVYYSASNEDGLGGHAFVCDGYDDQGYVHINWGWYGRSNGYFHINALNPTDLGIGANGGGYNLAQEIITGIRPADATVSPRVWGIYGATRLLVSPITDAFGTVLSCMSFVENQDGEVFDGEIAAVMVKDGQIVKVLKQVPLTLDGVNPEVKQLVDAELVQVKNISTEVPDVADGSYKIQYAFKPNGEENWTILRQPNSLPNYADVTVVNGVITDVVQHIPTPDVTLLEKITPDGTLYAKGSGKFKVHVKNNTNDLYLNRIWLKFISVDDPTKEFILKEDSTITHNVYDNSEKEVYLLIDLPAELTPGKYKVIAYEMGFENNPFKEDIVGETILEVKEEATTPVIRQVSDYEWYERSSGEMKLKQGQQIVAKQLVRNYGQEGKVGLLLKMVDVNDASKVFPVIQVDTILKKQEQYVPLYNKRIDLDPGKYRLESYYVIDGKEYLMEGTVAPCVVEVLENPDLLLTCVDLVIPDTAFIGKRFDGTITLKANKDIKYKTVYIRMRPNTNKGGALVFMKSLNMTAGQEETFSFFFRPSTTMAPGTYNFFTELKMTTTEFESVANAAKATGTIVVVDPTGIEAVENNENQASVQIVDNGRAIRVDNPSEVKRLEIFATSGAKVFSQNGASEMMRLSLSKGIYILRVTANDSRTTTQKFIVK